MFGLSGLRLYGAIAALLALLGALGWLVHTVRDRDRLATIVDKHEACSAALTGKSKLPIDASCEPAIVEAVLARDAAATCDTGLGTSNLYVIRMSCSAPVKALQARAAAAADNVADLTAQLVQARTSRDQAVVRADRRGVAATQRIARAQTATLQAPHDADGLVVCAGDCLRALGGHAPATGASADRR